MTEKKQEVVDFVLARMEKAWEQVKKEHPEANRDAFSLGIKAAQLKGPDQAAFTAGMDVVINLYEKNKTLERLAEAARQPPCEH